MKTYHDDHEPVMVKLSNQSILLTPLFCGRSISNTPKQACQVHRKHFDLRVAHLDYTVVVY